MTKILAPLNGLDSYRLLVDAGARELYVGFLDPAWDAEFGPSQELNRLSGFSKQANALTLEDVLTVAGWCSQDEVSLFITFNAASYSNKAVAYISEHYLPKLAEAKIAGIIVSSPQLISSARAIGLGCVASTLCGVTNHLIAQQYADLGVSRIVLPRHLTLSEIEGITSKVKGVEWEAFAMRNGCVFEDSLCMGAHRSGRPSLCRSLRESQYWECPTGASQFQLMASVATNDTWANCFHINACGLCAVKSLMDAGVDSLKVVGRCDPPEEVAESIALLSGALNAAMQSESAHEAIRNTKRPEPREYFCGSVQGMACYYPKNTFLDFMDR